ncbi:MAG: cytochrome P450 [Burkholderiales bacterium]|nr:cytochrome P450 [Burkholderiales bacterium]
MTTPPLAVDMRDPAFRNDPHPLLHAVRARGRAERDVVGIWLATHHADCSAGLRSNQLSREVTRMPGYAQMRPYVADSMLERTCERWMLFNDPPVHTRLRRLVNAAFKPAVVQALRARVAAITAELLAALPTEPGATFDLMPTLAQPLPVRVICDVMGLPAEDFAQTKQWADALALIVEPVIRRAEREAASRAGTEMVEYLRAHIARQRASGERESLLGTLVAAHDADDGALLSEDELLGNLILLFVAGHETTTNLIGNGMLTLLRHPEALAQLRADPETLMPGAVDEMLRYESSVNMVARHVVAPYAIGETVVPSGDVVFFMTGAANRDPAVFAEPDRFDITRSPNPHLAFGAGIHYCVGAPLARMEAEVAFGELLRERPGLALAEPETAPAWRKLINLRGLEMLSLREA